MMLARVARLHRRGLGAFASSLRGFHASAAAFSIKVKMPSLSPTMAEGQIVKWLKQEGEQVAAGDVICDIQTDKAVVSLETDEDGTMAKIFKSADDGTIRVGTIIALLAEDGEDWKDVATNFASHMAEGSGDEDGGREVSAAAAAPVAAAAPAPVPSGGSTPGTVIKMPALSPTMTEGTIVKWCKQEGDKIEAGEVLCEIQTDKAVVSMEVDDDAVLAKILVPEGTDNVKIGTMIALSVMEGEDWKDVQIPAPEGSSSTTVPAASAAPAAVAAPAAASAAPAELHFQHLHNVGPATNLLIAQYGLEPSKLPASGPKGLVKGDVIKFIKDHKLEPVKVAEVTPMAKTAPEPAKKTTPAAAKATVPSPGAQFTDIPLSTMRAVIAKRLVQSKQTSPHGHATVDCKIDSLGKIRKEFLQLGGVKLSVNDLVIKAAAATLQYVPEVNINVVGDDDFRLMTNVDVSVAVATDQGLITPIVKNVPALSLPEISEAVRSLAIKARNGQLKLDEFQGGTFTISNLGMFGISEFTAIINPPQGAILAVGKGSEEVDPSTGKTCTMMRATLSFDRRFIDEFLAVDFMTTLRKVLEHPEYMNIGPVPIVRSSRASVEL